MDIVLGVSMTPTNVHMVAVHGEKADGPTMEHDTFEIGAAEGTPTSSATDHVLAAIMGTREGAVAGGHRLVSTGVAWSDHAQAAELRQALADRRIDGVTFVSQLQAARALAQAAGGLFGYTKPALLLAEHDDATVAVVDMADDAAIIKVDSQPLTDADAAPVLTDMLTALKGHASSPDGMFVIGSGRDLSAVIEQANEVLSIPVSAPADGEIALARGAALAAADVGGVDPPTTTDLSGHEPPTAALAYSQDTDALRATAARVDDVAYAQAPADGARAGKPFVLAGSAMAGIFTIGVVSLVITLAVSIRPTADTLPGPAFGAAPPAVSAPEHVLVPPSAMPPVPAPPSAVPPVPPPAAAPPPSAVPPPPPASDVAPPPALAANVAPPTVAQAPPRPAAVPAPAPEAPPPAPAAPPPAPPPAEAAPAPVAAVPDNPYPPAYGPGPGYSPTPAYGPGPGYSPPPAYGPGPGYGPQPAIPIIPGILSIGPAPSYRGPDRWGPRQWQPGPGYAPGRRGGVPPWLWPGG